jgi:putative two-component system response regulator
LPDIILADFSLPQFNALRALEHLKNRGLDIPFIVVTGNINEELSADCIKQGASDFLNKDRLSRLGQAVERALEQKRLRDEQKHYQEELEKAYTDLTKAYEATIEGWSSFLDLRDHETEGHTQRVTNMTLILAEEIGFSKEELIHVRRGCLLHDIGKLGVPDNILLKEGPLTDEEWVKMRLHPQFAYDRISPIEYLRPALDIPFCHHERWDGSGYPRGLKGEEIPLSARIFSIVDVWDALLSNRPYRQGCTEETVLEYIVKHSGIQFDPRLVEEFEKLYHKGVFKNTQTLRMSQNNKNSSTSRNAAIP